MTTSTSSNLPKLLSDEPALVDSFGAHERIASALVTLICTSPGGKSIRLDGAWGAGKSTVVESVKAKLGSTANRKNTTVPKTSTFTYDAWVHSGEGLRRAFLVALVENFKATGWIPKGSTAEKDWDDRLMQMAGKRKRVEKKVSPTLSKRTRVGISLGLTAVFMAPVFYKCLASIFENWPIDRLALLSICVAVILFFVILRLGVADLQALLSRSSLEDITDTTTDPDPTSVEFQDAFGKLMSQCLIDSRKLVIVVDNLDRVESDELRQVWTLLRSFLDNSAFRRKEWFQRLWLLVPVAEQSLLDDAGASAGVLDKVFQVRMSLPHPMLRSWKEFLATRLQLSFGAPGEQNAPIIARMFHSVLESGAPMPRDIVLFVNELVALHIERGGDIPLATLAAYLLSRRATRARLWDVPQSIAQVYFDATIQQDFATLFLHAERGKDSLYLLVSPALERALEMGNPDALGEALDSSSASLDVLEQFLTKEFARMAQAPEFANNEQDRYFAYLRALTLFTSTKPGDQRSNSFLGHIRICIDQVAYRLTSLKLNNPNIAEGIEAYIDISVDTGKAAARVDHLLRTMPQPEETTFNLLGAWKVWVRSLVEILTKTKARGWTSINESRRLELRLTIDQWAQLCMTLSNDVATAFALKSVALSDSDDVLADWIVGQLLPAVSDWNVVVVFKQRFDAQGPEFFEVVCQKLLTVMAARGDMGREHILECLARLARVSPEDARRFIRSLIDRQIFFRWMGESETSVTVDGVFGSFALAYLWACQSLPPAFSKASFSLPELMREFFLTNRKTSDQITTICSAFVAHARIYDVLGILANVSDTRSRFLAALINGLCSYDDFIRTAEAELRGESVDGPKVLSGNHIDSLRTIVRSALPMPEKTSDSTVSRL
ncbi:KAP NTPase domain-containing protein [Pararobbsia alpina]